MNFAQETKGYGFGVATPEGCDNLQFDVGVKLGKKFECTDDDGAVFNHYILPGNKRRLGIGNEALFNARSDGTPVVIKAPNLSALGHDLNSGDWTGQLQLSFSPKPLIVTGCGGLKSVENIWDDETDTIVHHEVVVTHHVDEYGFRLDVGVVVKQEDLPADIVESFIPGSRVSFAGTHIEGSGDGGLIKVK
ncbi:hypothetical protein PTTG_30500, partial [Puccinia triticina 1-1 BBBD Race 1]